MSQNPDQPEVPKIAAEQTESTGIISTVLDTLALILGYIAHMADAVPVPFPFNYVAVGMGLVFVTVIGFYIGVFVLIVLLFLALLGFFGFGFLDFL